MNIRRTLLAVLGLLPLGAAAALSPDPGYLPLWSSRTGHIADLVLIYQGGVKRLPWTQEQLAPYLTRKNRDSGREEWLFDGFLFIEFSDGQGHEYAAGYTRKPAAKEQWEWLLARNFSPSNAIAALDRITGAAIERLGTPAVPRKVVLTLPEPIPTLTNWGTLAGRTLDFRKTEDRVAACEWHIDQALARWKETKPRHLQLSGFYWVAENANHAAEVLPMVSKALHARGLSFYWIPYWNALGAAKWKELGFDYAWQQPNHFFHPDKVPDSRLAAATALARTNGLGLEFEADQRAMTDPARFRPRFYSYLEAFRRDGVAAQSSIAYYEGGGALLSMANSQDSEVQKLYEAVAEFVAQRQKRLSRSE